ncbi:MAG: hypothetical protein VW080_08945 [Flavobacteriaceae bacterium]|jgi:hypothetical protein
MKTILRLLFVLLLGSLAYGLYYKSQMDFATGERIIGFTVLGGAFIFLPLFLYHRWKGKRLKDYTLSEENLKKMKGDE